MQDFINALAFLAEDGEGTEGALRIIGGGLPLVIAVVCVFLYARYKTEATHRRYSDFES